MDSLDTQSGFLENFMNGRLIWISLLLASLIATLASLAGLPGWAAALLTLSGGIALAGRILFEQQRTYLAHLASLNAAVIATDLPMAVVCASGQLRKTNPAFLRLAMLREDTPVLATTQLLPKAWIEFIRRLAEEASEKGCCSQEIMLPRGDRTVLVRTHALPYRDTSDTLQIALTWEDISGQSRVLHEALQREKQLLARSQTFIQTLINVIPQPVYIKRLKDGESRYQMVNEAFCSHHDRSRGALLGLSTEELLRDTDIADTVLKEDQRALDGGLLNIERQVVDTATGKPRHTLVTKFACTDPEGLPVVVGSCIDITPWRAAEQNLRLALQREVERREQVQSFIQRLIDMIPYPVHLKDSRGCYQMVNDAFVRDRGCHREELLGKNSVEVAKAVDNHLLGSQDAKWERAQLSMEEDARVLAGETIVKEEHNTHPVTGAERFRTVYKGGGLDADGRPVIVTAFFDVTKWRLAERALTESLAREKAMHERTHDFLQRLIDLIPEEFYVKDAESRYLLVNEAFLLRRGLTGRNQAIGRSMEDVVQTSCHNNPLYQANPDLLAAALRDHYERISISRDEDLQVLEGHTITKEDHHILPHSGEERFFEVVKVALTDAAGQPVIVCANFNVTALRQAQRRLNALEQAPSDSADSQDDAMPPVRPASAC